MEPPDRLEKGIRFGCGFFFGFVVLASSSLVWFWLAHTVVACGLLAGLCGYVAMKYGDGFWLEVHEFWRKLRWWGW